MGRKLEFSKDKALEQAMESFWAQGYDSTSMRDLAQRLNLHLGSVYNALGDKEQVFEQALRLYLKNQIIPRMHKLQHSEDPRAALQEFLSTIAADCQKDSTSPGCFIMNSLLCITRINDNITATVNEYMKIQEDALSACIASVQSNGHISGDENPRQLARFIIASCKALHAMKKIGVNDDYIRDVQDSIARRVFKRAA